MGTTRTPGLASGTPGYPPSLSHQLLVWPEGGHVTRLGFIVLFFFCLF